MMLQVIFKHLEKLFEKLTSIVTHKNPLALENIYTSALLNSIPNHCLSVATPLLQCTSRDSTTLHRAIWSEITQNQTIHSSNEWVLNAKSLLYFLSTQSSIFNCLSATPNFVILVSKLTTRLIIHGRLTRWSKKMKINLTLVTTQRIWLLEGSLSLKSHSLVSGLLLRLERPWFSLWPTRIWTQTLPHCQKSCLGFLDLRWLWMADPRAQSEATLRPDFSLG